MPAQIPMRVRRLGPGQAAPLAGEWALAALPAGTATGPDELPSAAPDWISCSGPQTAAAALRASGRWSLEGDRDFDAEDWWFRCRFDGSLVDGPARIRFEGLATIADVWLNGVPLLHSENMFLAHEPPAPSLRSGANELLIRCHALTPRLAEKRPRPRWKTRLVDSQQLRWYRTTLLGRIREWCPRVAPVGPWRNVLLVPEATARLSELRLDARLDGLDGVVRVAVALDGHRVHSATLALGERTVPLAVSRTEAGVSLEGEVRLTGVEAWWPHTHGAQPRYPVELTVDADGERIAYSLGPVGFRTVEVERGDDGRGFGLRINGQSVFCRGACWTPLDLAGLPADPADHRAALEQARDAGMNMIRVGGTMVYEDESFYEACDELGILVWQDFMFANLDYPMQEPAFAAQVGAEARQFLSRMQGRPSLAVLCGSSELQQQAAMFGLPAERWSGPEYVEVLAACSAELAPGIPWVDSSPSGGTLPFHNDQGVAHYFGVGAYRRPLDDARRAGVRFASECLAFSNVPEPELVNRLGAGWKAGVPRDPGAEWDFEDVRNHYVDQIFAPGSSGLPEENLERRLALGRVTTGEVMERTAGEWRRPGSSCRGALIWFLRDLIPGAGWGVVDADGRPKAAYWYLRRAWAPVGIIVGNEGLNGLYLHAVNDGPAVMDAHLRVTAYRCGKTPIASATIPASIPGRGTLSVHADGLFDGFLDLTYAYRFGEPGHSVVAAVLTGPAGEHLASAFHWPCGLPRNQTDGLGLRATATRSDTGYLVRLEADEVAVAVALRAEGFTPDDNYVSIEPGHARSILMRRDRAGAPFNGTIAALNGASAVPIVVSP